MPYYYTGSRPEFSLIKYVDFLIHTPRGNFELHPALIGMNNATSLLHIGSARSETRFEMESLGAGNLIAFHKDRVPPNCEPAGAGVAVRRISNEYGCGTIPDQETHSSR